MLGAAKVLTGSRTKASSWKREYKNEELHIKYK
jgi:hypothetical protein